MADTYFLSGKYKALFNLWGFVSVHKGDNRKRHYMKIMVPKSKDGDSRTKQWN